MKRILSIFFLLFSFHTLLARTIPVGHNEAVKTVRQGIEAAMAGDTVLVKKGLYKESNLLLSKPIVLIGEAGATLDGEGKNEILQISGQGIVVKGLTFQNSGYSSMDDLASIKVVDASGILIENNIINRAFFAIHINNSNYCVIQQNIISGLTKTEQTSGNGIHLWKCDNMLVKENQIKGHRDGIYFEFVTNSVIEKNISHNNIRYGLHFMFSNDDSYLENTFLDNGAGVAVMYSKRVVMVKNHFQHNWGPSAYGLLLKEISDAQIILNEFDQNTVAILMESTNRLEVRDNNFKSSGYAMRIQAS
ncbi:MAG: nitrous oxide reductase family maturation protein NosD, partial [Chitinophagaceae bacterium]